MKVLVVSPSYPNKDRVKYKFLHDRIKAYNESKKIEADVFCLDGKFENDYIYEGVEVSGGNDQRLLKKIKLSNYDAFVFHFLKKENAKFILKYLYDKKTYIWFHGSDSIDWKRRLCGINILDKKDLINPLNIVKAIVLRYIYNSRKKLIIKLNNECVNNKFVFVSDWLKNTSESDYKIKYINYQIINNFIQIDFFKYNKKTKNDRFNVLSISDFSTGFYAGDMLEKIILKFSKNRYFKKFNFTIYGDGKFFDKYTKSLKKFENVKISKGFLKQEQIMEEHKKHGLFLYPKRGDSQGVSRCEAMASGLVPLASNVEAISEFSPSQTSYLPMTIDEFIKELIFIAENPKDFLKKSEESARFIREKCNYENTIKKEIEMFLKKEKRK